MGNIRNIKTLAKEKGVSLAHLCKSINKSHGYLTEFASRDADVPEQFLPILAEALHVSVEDLSGEEKVTNQGLTAGQIVCKQINLILARKGIKKSDFYNAVGITAGAFSSWNLGRANPSRENLSRIADYLGVPVSALTEQKEKPTAQGDGLSDAKREAVDLIMNCSDDNAEKYLKILKIYEGKDDTV